MEGQTVMNAAYHGGMIEMDTEDCMVVFADGAYQASETDFMVLYTSVKKILKEMCEQGGRDTEKDLFRQKGRYITQLRKNTLFEPCVKCGHEIHKVNFLGGTVYYCENCQKK